MQMDVRIKQLAENIIKKSIKLKKGEKVYIEGFSDSVKDLFQELIRQAVKAGAIPYWQFNDNAFIKAFVDNASEAQMKEFGQMQARIMAECSAYVAVRGYDDLFMMSDIKPKQQALYMKHYYTPVHFDIRVPKTRWCVLRYPNKTMAAVSKMSVETLENFYFDACLVDYAKMGKAMETLKKLMEKTDKVRIVAPETDLSFSIKNIPVIASQGTHNLPDGEVYTAPVKNSINGVIRFNTDTLYEGEFFSRIHLEFKNGKIINGTSAANNQRFQQILNHDEGSRYIGEFAIGVNPYVVKPMLDILFDEKISGSLHMAIGNAYDEAFNGNRSDNHWDLVLIQTKEWGGGEIWFDDKLIRKDGKFVLPELKKLNPENLK